MVKRKQLLKYSFSASVALITFIVYLSSLQNDFINWDDGPYVFENPHIRSFDMAFFKWIFFDFHAAYWHPLTWVSHALDYAIWGLDPMGHHLTNNILHAVTSCLVVFVVIGLFEAWKTSATNRGLSDFFTERMILVAGGVTGLLFGLHPLHVESAVWIAERKDLLCALFFLLSIIRYISYVTNVKDEEAQKKAFSRFSNKNYLLTVGFFILALFSKPMAVSLPVVLLILDWYPFNRIQSLKTFRSALFEKLPFIAFSLITSLLIILAQRTGGAMATMENIPLSSRVLVAGESLIAYLWKMIWPLDLFPFYPYPTNISLLSLEYLSPIVLVAGITFTCIVRAKKEKLWLTVWGYYVVTLIPVLGLVQVGPQARADRFTYLPSLGPFLIIGLATVWIFKKADIIKRWGLIIKVFSAVTVALVFIALSYATYTQIGLWKNCIVLWNYVIDKEHVTDYIAYNNRGVCYEKAGQIDKAAEDYRATIDLHPSDDQAYFNLGVISYNAGSFDQAIIYYNQSIAINPKFANAYHNRGVVYSFSGQPGRALDDFNKAIELNQSFAIAYFNRGNLFFKTGQKELASADYQKACDLGYAEGCNAFH